MPKDKHLHPVTKVPHLRDGDACPYCKDGHLVYLRSTIDMNCWDIFQCSSQTHWVCQRAIDNKVYVKTQQNNGQEEIPYDRSRKHWTPTTNDEGSP